MGDVIPAPRGWNRKYEKAQRDPDFLGWVAMNEAVVDLEFLVEEVPDLPDRPWGADALAFAEAAALRRFPDKRVFTPDNQKSAWRYIRFIGQVYAEAFEAHWVAVPEDDGTLKPKMLVPFSTLMFKDPVGNMTAAMSRRTGTEWSFVYGRADLKYREWIANGRTGSTDPPAYVPTGTEEADDAAFFADNP